MNRGVHRLIFNHQRGTLVAVAEHVRGRGKKASRRRRAAVLLGLAALAGSPSALAVRPPLPEPSSGNRPFVFAGAVRGGAPTVSGNDMTIVTDSRTLGLNWRSFNIGSDASVTFVQPDTTARVLNRIWSSDPSVILGRLSANGQVYLINQNGILFGSGAQVNVGGLVASAVNLTEPMANQLLNRGLPSTRGERLEFAWDGSLADFAKGFVSVEAGARITTPSGGKVVLIAPKTVENLGLIESGGGGEAILAAGGKVVLTAPDDPALRGLLVETGAFSGRDELGNTVAVEGSVTNRSDGTAGSGRIDMGRGGVVSLAALAVNQKGFVNATRAVNLNGNTMLVSGTTETDRLTVNQRGDVAQIDWVSGFGVGVGKIVEFIQPSAGAVAYNYVYDPDRKLADGSLLNLAGRSRIDGILKATGQFVLVNERGITFGSQARVTAGNFVASALGLNPNIVASGLLGQTDVGQRAFYLNKTPVTYDETDGNSRLVLDQALAAYREATVAVQAGAEIATTGSNGYVILAGGQVTQSGRIATPGGQTLLAAGADVYLKPGYAAANRGFTAEVNPLYAVRTRKFDGGGNAVEDTNRTWLALSRGSDVNRVLNQGSIDAGFGDITLVGHDVFQGGVLRAATSTAANGSIHLVARDQLNTQGEGEPTAASIFWRQYGDQGILAATSNPVSSTAKNVTQFVAGQSGGTLTFGAGSRTVVDIDGNSARTLTKDQPFVKSTIDGVARQVVVENADLVAKGGNIRLRGSDAFSEFSAFAVDSVKPIQSATAPAGVGVFVGDGARIDVSGEQVSKSVADLFIAVELRGDEFAANPVQRNGALRGLTAWVDIRDKVALADISGWTSKVGLTAQERAAGGGTISLGSTGSVVIKSAATLDVSGGRVDYAAGTVQESLAVTLGGNSYRLNDAPADARYATLITRSRQEAGYVEGKSAGTVEVSGHSLAIDGQLVARTTVGTRQREVGDPATNRLAIPLGGELIVRDAGQHFVMADRDRATEEEKQALFSQAQIAFVRGAATSANGLQAGDTAGPRLELSQSLVDAGFSRFAVTSDGRIEVPADVALSLGAGGSFKASGRQVVIAGDIRASGGTIELSTRDMSLAGTDFPNTQEARFSDLVIQAGAELSTAGRWVNDLQDGRLTNSARAIDGGSITLTSAHDVDLRAGSRLDVSGGGQLTGKAALVAGNAGSITLETGGVTGTAFAAQGDNDRRDASLFADGTLAGYALGKGGTLTVKTSRLAFGTPFGQDSRTWDRDRRLASGQVGAAFSADFVDRGGFFAFNFVGRDGANVADRLVLSPDPVSWSLQQAAAYRSRPTGSALADFARGAALHPELRSGPTQLSLTTSSPVFGTLNIGQEAYVGVSAQGSIKLESAGQLTVRGTLEAPAGSIGLSRPVTYAYSEAKQSESIYLGESARLLAGGATVLSADTRQALEAGLAPATLLRQGRYKGQVLNGGTVNIAAGLGYLVTRPGSLIDVSGTVATLNAPTLVGTGAILSPRTLGSAGGSVNLSARDGLFLDGGFTAGGRQGAQGGLFTLAFADAGNGDNPWGLNIPVNPVTGLPDRGQMSAAEQAVVAPRQLTLYQAASDDEHRDAWPADQVPGANLDPAAYNGRASLDLARLVAGGFGSWSLRSQNDIRWSGPIAATVNNQLQLRASSFTAAGADTSVRLNAAAISLGNDLPGAPAVSAGQGRGTATFSALDIGLVGTFAWNGFATTNFNSRGAIHFDSTLNTALNRAGGRLYNGQMTAAGTLSFAAARLSPATYSDFRVDVSGDPSGTINISRLAGSAADPSLSPAGRLEFAAATIEHKGTVTAPLGEIVFTAPTGEVTLGADSVTSVAADRALWFGYTAESGRSWNYLGNKVETLPGKGIRIDAGNTVLATGARLDLSAGGEAVAWEFIAGPGGKSDVLAGSANTFAIMPTGQHPSVTDGDLLKPYLDAATGQSALKVGDSITLNLQSLGLVGSYVLLPARYALSSGAYLVTFKGNAQVGNNRVQADGSWLTYATRQTLNADGSASTYGASPLAVEVAGHNVVAGRAAYNLTTASRFFFDQAGATLAGDAGRLTAIGRQRLTFDPTIVAMRQAEVAAEDGRKRAGRGLEVDLAAPKLLVSDSAAVPDESWSRLDQGKVNGLGASSLLIGGARTTEGERTRIDTLASEVLIRNSGQALVGDEVMISAGQRLTVAANSQIESAGSAGSRNVVLTGDGAFLRVAEGDQAALSREGSVGRTTGHSDIQSGATVAGRSVIIDATASNTLAGRLVVGNRRADGSRSGGGKLAVGAGRINIVAGGDRPAEGLNLGTGELAGYAQADQLRLTSYSSVDFYGGVTLGAPSLNELIIAAAGLAGHGDGQTVAAIVARQVTLTNASPEASRFVAGADMGQGRLAVSAETLVMGGNASAAMRNAESAGLTLAGFSEVTLKSSGDLRFAGTGVTRVGTGEGTKLILDAGRVTTVGTADHLLVAGGVSEIKGGGNGAEATGLGGKLDIRGQSLDVSGRIDVAGGSLALTATGTGVDGDGRGTDHVRIRESARLRAEGQAVAFADTQAFAPGGKITLQANRGNVVVDAGAVLSVSASPAGGDAGRLALLARQGEVAAGAGTLQGRAQAGAEQGSLQVDGATLSLDNLAAAVVDAGGNRHFTGAWDIRQRTGNLTLNRQIKAAEVSLAADNGGVTIGSAGVIDASGDKGGAIALYGRNGDVTLAGQLLARSQQAVSDLSNAGTRGRGGSVLLSASGSGEVVTEADSLIDVGVAEGSLAQGGRVTFRAAEYRPVGSTAKPVADSLRIKRAGRVVGASDVGAELVSSYTGTSLTAGTTSGQAIGLSTLKSNLDNLYSASNMAALRTALGFGDNPAYHVRAGVDIATPVGTSSDFTVAADLDFSTLRFAGEAGVLTLRAGRDLKINGTLSDGFSANGSNTSVSRDAKLNGSGPSWSYRLVAGADGQAASPMAYVDAPAVGATAQSDALALKGSIEVAANKLVRTGTGSIDLAARRDIKLNDRAAVFTAGTAATTQPDGFSAISGGTTQNSISSVFPSGGGNLNLKAGERVLMVSSGETAPTQRHINQWLFRAGGSLSNLQWWPRIASFQQGVAAFGGGDIRVQAGQEVKNLVVAIPTNGRVPRVNGENQPDSAVIQGGGDLVVRTDGAVNGGLYYVETGHLKLKAGQVKGNTGLALGNTTAQVAATGDVALGNVFNPLWGVGNKYVYNKGNATDTNWAGNSGSEYTVRIGTYGEDSAVEVVSVAGNVGLNAKDDFYGISDGETQRLMPARVRVAALNGSIAGSVAQAPGTNGQLDLLARTDITLTEDAITQLDLPASLVPSIRNPMKNAGSSGRSNFQLLGLARNGSAAERHSATGWHAGDGEASRLIALNGKIAGISSLTSWAEFSEPVRVQAGGDIVNLNLNIQHNHASDTSSVVAGGQLRYDTYNSSGVGGKTEVQAAALGIQVGGPGHLDVVAGGNIDLADTWGIVSRGNLDNPGLPEGGASILAVAGAQPDYESLRAYLQASVAVTPAELRQRFFTQLRDYGREALAGGGDASYDKGRALVRALFPTARVGRGDILLAVSQIKTEQGGDIQLLTPGGSIVVGLPDPALVKKSAAQGIFTVRDGAIQAFARDDFLVNQSRVFTLDGGDIVLWADQGNIDAGSGAKTVSATPPPVLVVRNGQLVLDASNAISGSGIGILSSRDDSPVSDMDLYAPRGAIDAGDAGIRVRGKFRGGAKFYYNDNNIQAGGGITGGPTAAPAVTPVAAVTSPTNSESRALEDAPPAAGKRGGATAC